MEQENIIQIRQRDIHAANEAFSDFMSKTENYLNEKALSTKGLYQQCSGTELETVALGALHEIAPSKKIYCWCRELSFLTFKQACIMVWK